MGHFLVPPIMYKYTELIGEWKGHKIVPEGGAHLPHPPVSATGLETLNITGSLHKRLKYSSEYPATFEYIEYIWNIVSNAPAVRSPVPQFHHGLVVDPRVRECEPP
jgi:hypothetical protein